MRLRRTLLCSLAIGLVVSTGVATARPRPPAPKPKVYCNLLQDDKKDDGSWRLGQGLVTSPAFDILSGDVATNGSKLVAVLRVGSVETANDNWSKVFAYDWTFSAIAGGATYTFNVHRPANTTGDKDVWSAKVGDVAPPVAHTVDKARNAFVWTLKRPDVKAMARPKQVWTTFNGETSAFSSTSDHAASLSSKYPDKGLSCIPAEYWKV